MRKRLLGLLEKLVPSTEVRGECVDTAVMRSRVVDGILYRSP